MKPSEAQEQQGVFEWAALGNAVVPQQVYPILKTIMEIEKA